MSFKRGTSRGTAVLDAPEETYASEFEREGAEVSEPPAVREPAPAGAFQRARERAASGESLEEEAYVPKRGAPKKFNLRASVPKSVAGRLVAASLAVLTLGAAAVIITAVEHSLMRDERFMVATSSDIEISGNQHLTRSQLLSVFGADLERNIFKVPLAERRTDLERLPWVEHATVMRLLPNHLRVKVMERTPVAFVRQGTQIGLVDANGVLLDMPQDAAGDPHYSFPVLTGLNAGDPQSTRAARMAIYASFMKDLGGDTDDARKRTASLSEVDVTNPEDIKALVALNGSDVLVHFGDEKFLERYNEFAEHLSEWKSQYPKLSAADMRYEHQVVLEMQGAAQSNAAAATANPAAPAATTPAMAPATAAAKPAPVAAKPAAKAPAKEPPAKAKAEAAKRLMAQKLARARAAAKAHTTTHPAKANQ
ncbi:cell division protein FtsQ/DivIB [Granulicella cerasi]|uniref:Cell division protein FtsQ n=1 Tax=Granulicella cerasi TaxID=741063 RepID=A0ABW1ZDY9_9BACT|nr:FtsQ-type POTRA domain-containing protein [Granulicella cerasi]